MKSKKKQYVFPRQTEELRRAKWEFTKRNPKKLEDPAIRETLVWCEAEGIPQDEIYDFMVAAGPAAVEDSEVTYKALDRAFLRLGGTIDDVTIPGGNQAALQKLYQRSGVTEDQFNEAYLEELVKDAVLIVKHLYGDRPSKRQVISIDLTRSTESILEEVRKHVQMGKREVTENRLKWLPITYELLTVWDAWAESGQRRCFRQIAKKLNLSESTVKDRWRLAYRLIHGEAYSREASAASADELCASCKDNGKCYRPVKGILDHYPCPAYLKLAGKSYSREKLLENVDDLLDSTE